MLNVSKEDSSRLAFQSTFHKNYARFNAGAGNILMTSRDKTLPNKLSRIIEGTGLFIQPVWNDKDMLLELLERNYHSIIYDLNLSNSNGPKTVKIIRRIKPKVSLLVISDDVSKELGGEILQEGVAYYAVKSVNPYAIRETLFRGCKKTNIN